MSSLGLAWVVSVVFCGLSAQALAENQTCSDLLVPKALYQKAKRAVTANDLIGLRDIGPVGTSVVNAPMLGLSPDGTHVAFQVRRADLSTNSYCLGMFVAEVTPDAVVTMINSGGEFVRQVASSQGFAAYISAGNADVPTPKWSPDGLWVAFLRRDKGITQVWRAKADGTFSEPVTHFSFDVETLAWTNAGALMVSGRPALGDARAAIAKEGDKGFLFDERFVPASSNRPLPRGPLVDVYFIIDPNVKAVRSASPDELAYVNATDGKPKDAILYAEGGGGRQAWTEATDQFSVTSPTTLRTRVAGKLTDCTFESCTNILQLWWSMSKDKLIFLKREGRAQSQMAIYAWSGQGPPRRVMTTDNALIGCQLAGARLVCAEEGSLQPRRLSIVDMETGIDQRLFDPNPELAGLRLGDVKRLYVRNPFGIDAFADLVLPPDHVKGTKYPLIVVGYESRGFLRGGTGDEVPIQLFATHGFAVLSFQRPSEISNTQKATSYEDLNRLNRIGWADWRNVQSSVEGEINLAVADGAVDASRIGLTGFSNGAATAIYSLINGRHFVAASLGSCCEDTFTNVTLFGPVFTRRFETMGYPKLTAPSPEFWQAYSLTQNVQRMTTPVLLQLPDTEYLAALESYTALREQNRPIEMYVFPDENHMTWQPVHRAAMYERNLDWFEFWLKGVESPDPGKRAQYERWNNFKKNQNSGMSATPGP